MHPLFKHSPVVHSLFRSCNHRKNIGIFTHIKNHTYIDMVSRFCNESIIYTNISDGSFKSFNDFVSIDNLNTLLKLILQDIV